MIATARSDAPGAAPSIGRPEFSAALAQDATRLASYAGEVDAALKALGEPGSRDMVAQTDASALKREAQRVREAFLRRHVRAIYRELTDDYRAAIRVPSLLYAAAERFPGLVPPRAQVDAERALKRQSAKEGCEIDQGLFIAHVLADEQAGRHLVHAMLRPKPESLELVDGFRRSGTVDLGRVRVERDGAIGHVTLTNPQFLNAEDDMAAAALETAVDLVLLDDRVQTGVLRGDVLHHPKYAGRRVFNAGINLTHLYFGQISFAEFILDRELGLLNKIYRGHWVGESHEEQFEDTNEKLWLGVVEAFAIGGGCQLLGVMDRVLAEPGSYFNTPASKEGFIPGTANLRLPRLVGIQQARQAIFFEKAFASESPEGRMVVDEIVEPADMDAAIARNCAKMVASGLTSAVSNRKAFRAGQEPIDVYRRYMATYSRQQAFCFYDPALIDNLERMWKPQAAKV